MPTRIFCVSYSVFNDNKVVMVPAPAIKGKASGTIETVSGASSLNMVNPKTISIAIKKITNEPAIAKDSTSNPITFNKDSPRKRNKIIKPVATKEAFSDSICPAFLRNSMITGMAPSMSIMANKTIEVDRIWLGLNFIRVEILCKGRAIKSFPKLLVIKKATTKNGDFL